MQSFRNLIIFTLLFLQGAQPWTIDLPEVRQYYFTKNGEVPPKNEASKIFTEGEVLYDNFYSNSPHHNGNPGYVGPVDDRGDDDDEDAVKGGQYAEDFEYQSYMEKKVNHIVASGARYLDGLRRAVEQYTRRLENCTSANFTTLVSSGVYETCKEATQKSEHVRRIAQLAMYTTRLLQERVYHQDRHEDPQEEKALLMRLASFLDTLTQLTGFEPDPSEYLTTTAPPSSSSLSPPADIGIPLTEDQRKLLMRCLANEAKSTEPATERCKIPLPKPLMDMFNLTEAGAPSNSPPDTASKPNSRQARSIKSKLISKTKPASLEDHSQTKNKKRIIDIEVTNTDLAEKNLEEHFAGSLKQETETVSKMAAAPDKMADADVNNPNPLVELMKYYAKYQAWANENPGLDSGHLKVEFQDGNRLMRLKKRSVDTQKDNRHLHPDLPEVPEDPFQDISAFIRHRSQPYLNPDPDQAERLKKYFKDLAVKVGGRPKRAYRSFGHYYPYRARVPEDPMQDISYYVKYKEGTEIRPNPVQAAQVRLGLEQVYQTGNIAVVQRYGSNYNPAIVDHVGAGLIRSAADAV